MTRIRGLAASMLILIGFGATGCSDGVASPRADDGPTASTSTASTDSWPPYELLTLEEPRPLVFARRIEPTDTEAITRQVVAEMVHALRTTFPPESLRVASSCELCQEVVDMADTANDEQVRYELDAWRPEVGEVEVLPGDEYADRYYRVVLRLGRPELRVLGRYDEQVDVLPSRDPVTVLVVAVLDEVDRWQVVLWDELDKVRERAGT